MEEPNYIDIKKIVDFTIKQLAVEIEKSYEESSITIYLEKYECQNIKELIYLLLCEVKPSDLNISLNMRQKIKDISDEVTNNESETEQLNLKIINMIQDKNELMKKVKEYEDLLPTYHRKTQELTQHINNLTAQLKSKSTSKDYIGK